MNKFLIFVLSFCFSSLSLSAGESSIEKRLSELERVRFENPLNGISLSGQMTLIYQSSDYSLHQNYTGSFTADLIVEKSFENGVFQIDVQFANGEGVDANAQGGAMVNNDIMENTDVHNQPYIAKAYYEHSFVLKDSLNFVIDIGKFGVNDFFDLGLGVSDQSTQFLNQAINNNGAFDFVQDLDGNGYTFGLRVALESDLYGVDLAAFSADSYLDNISKKHSIIAAIKLTPEWSKGNKSLYQVYAFKNFGEYGVFQDDGSFITNDVNSINKAENADQNDKAGWGVSLNHVFEGGIDIFAKYGKQDDDRDVRHYQDMDESIMFGFSKQGIGSARDQDALGLAYHIGKLTGNHRLAHENGYNSFFDRSDGIGSENYADERVLEAYYRFSLSDYSSFSGNYQRFSNFNYNKMAESVVFYGMRYNLAF